MERSGKIASYRSAQTHTATTFEHQHTAIPSHTYMCILVGYSMLMFKRFEWSRRRDFSIENHSYYLSMWMISCKDPQQLKTVT